MFTNTDRTIDSRDIIERIEALENERESLLYENGGGMSQDEFDNSDEGKELETLKELEEECKQYSDDWEYGETLIHRDYFNEYMDEMVEDCYQLPKDLPYWMNITIIDYDALEQDYISVYLDGEEYLILSC